MTVRDAQLEDMKLAGHIMSVSFRTAFSGFVSEETMDACAREESCIALLEGIVLKNVPEGPHFLSAAPLNLAGSDGAPCRSYLIAK